MIPLKCITRGSGPYNSLPRFVTQFHHPTRTKDHPTRAKKEIQQMRKKKRIYFIKETLFCSSSSYFAVWVAK